jgi:hypothetical protein
VHEARGERRWCRCALVGRRGRLAAGAVDGTFVIAASRGSRDARVVAVVTARRWVSALGSSRVEEGDQHALLHELVDLGHGFV